MSTIKQRNKRFEKYIFDLVNQPSTNSDELTPEKSNQRREQAQTEFGFCKTYYPDIFNEPFNALHEWINNKKSGKYTVSGHRDCGKSAYVYVAKVIRHIAEQKGGIVNINNRTYDKSKEMTSQIKRMVMDNDKLRYDYSIRLVQDEKGYYIFGNTHLVAGSVQTGLRGMVDDKFTRITLAVNDDLYDRTTVSSDLDNQKVVDFIESEVYGQLEKVDGLSFTLGNSITADCPIVTLKKKRPDNHYSFPALDENGESNWKGHSVYTTEYWQKKEKDTPVHVWAGDFMDEPFESGDTFDADWLRFVNINTINIIASISAIDPGRGQSPSACYKAIQTLGIDNSNSLIDMDTYIRKEEWPKVFDYIQELRHRIENWKLLYFENDFAQWEYAKPYYNDWLEEDGNHRIPMSLYLAKELAKKHFGNDKEGRILNLVHPHQTGKLKYNQELKGSKDFERYKHEYLAYGSEKQDDVDGLDALATAVIKIPQYKIDDDESGVFQSLKDRLFKSQSMFR